MRAMILAAGRGMRMGELTRLTPKPLLRIADRYLIEYALSQLQRAGFHEVVINVSYCHEQIMAALGNGQQYGLQITYSIEPERLETGGGIFQALPLLGDETFLVISCDIISQYPLEYFLNKTVSHAHLVMVANPSYHPQGDFNLQNNNLTLAGPGERLTYANIGLFNPALFAGFKPGHFRLTQVLAEPLALGQVSGEKYAGLWHNVGSPADLEHINQLLATDPQRLS
jgi:N-acetyl-alpha-D-muramate 1-phosphate uridylyltransferase